MLSVSESGKQTEDLATVTEIGAEFYGDPWVHVSAVHLWDGARRFAHWDAGDPEPKELSKSGGLLHWAVFHHVQRSLGLSVAVRYPINFDPPVDPSDVTLLSAFAVFL